MNRRTLWHLLFALMMTLVWGCDLPFFGDDSSDEESASAIPVGYLDPGIPMEGGGGDTAELQNLIDTAVAAGGFETLVAAVMAAGLADTLSDEAARFTVFAPTDDAFAALPEGVVEALLEDHGALTAILTYHAIPGLIGAAEIVALSEATMLNGETVTIEVTEAGVVLNGSVNVVTTDIMCTNGVIHVIDAVLIPPAPAEEGGEAAAEKANIVDTAIAAGTFTTLVTAVTAADLAGTLADEEKEFTVFAPTDDAFAKLPEGTVEALLEYIPTLTDILLYHVVDGAVFAETVLGLEAATTLQGSDVTIEVVDGGVVLNGEVNVIMTDIECTNGVIHVIDAVLLPAAEE